MKKTLRRTLAATTISAAVAATLTATTVGAEADQTSARAKLADYGFKGTASGARLIANNVEVLNINDAQSPLRCTRRLDHGREATSVLSTPEGSPIDLGAVSNQSRTYRDGQRVGTRSTSVLAPMQVGDTTGELTGGIPTPEIRIEGMTTVADAFHTPQGYGHEEAITDLDLTIDLLPGQDADQPLQDLLDAIETELLDPVLDVLETTVGGSPIEIPGLGSIALGSMRGKASNHHAESHANALEIAIDATGEEQRLILGDVHSRIGGPAPAGVFRSTSMPMDVDVADGSLRLGHVKPRIIRCEGTFGKVKTRKLASASVLLPDNIVAGVTGVEYRAMGKQRNSGWARGFEVNKIESFSIPALDLTIEGIRSRVGATKPADQTRVKKSASYSVGRIVYQGNEIEVPEPGDDKVVDGLGIIQTRVVTDGNKFGQRVTALRLTLTELGSPIRFDLGIAATRISPF